MKGLVNYFLCFLFCLLGIYAQAQTFGANSPTTGANNAGFGTNAWTTPTNILTSNNARATCSVNGLTNYLQATGFGFTLPATTSITGIQLDVEESTTTPTVVTLLDAWTAGLTRTVSAGSNRMLLFIYSSENGNGSRDLTGLTYGGQALTQIVQGTINTGFEARIEFWVLLNAGLNATTSSVFSTTFAATTLTENVEYYASAVYQGVDQALPYTSTLIYTVSGNTTPITVSPTLAATAGGMVVSAIHCGQNTTPGKTAGGTDTYLVSNTFTETIDTYTSNAGFSTSGICTEIAHRSFTAASTTAPSYTFAGSPNRQLVVYVNLVCQAEIDNSVRLIKAGSVVGSNLAYTASPWNTVDTYTSYGSSSNMWGTTWVNTDVNATNFGAALSASLTNGDASVDHMRITITAINTLPIELIDFSGEPNNKTVKLNWQTATEINNKKFEIQRSDGISDFEKIGTISGSGNSSIFKAYQFVDSSPKDGLNYYRLKQIDIEGTFQYSKIIYVNKDKETSFEVYPNPSFNGNFTVSAKQLISEGVYIYSKEMKLIKMVEANNKDALDVSITELTDGTYYLITNINGQQSIKQIMKACR